VGLSASCEEFDLFLSLQRRSKTLTHARIWCSVRSRFLRVLRFLLTGSTVMTVAVGLLCEVDSDLGSRMQPQLLECVTDVGGNGVL
jgi:hypothetical protein